MIALLFLAAQAMTPAPAAVPAVDPARLSAAHALVDQVMPPAQREAMMRSMIAPMFGNMRQAMMQNPEFAKLAGNDPRVTALIQRFAEKMLADSMNDLMRGMPGLMDAMATAYARQFTVPQLDEVRAFYASPTGHDFMSKLPAIMSDPAIVQAQGAMMSEQMARMPERMKELSAEFAKLAAEKKKEAGK